MIFCKKTLYSIIIFVNVMISGYGQNIEYYDLKGKLQTTSATSIVQDDFGFIWIGSDNGVARFDGYTLEPLQTTNDSIFIGYVNFIKNINQSLYIGTNEGLYIYDYINNRLTLPTPELLNQNIISFIRIGVSSFIGTNAGLYVFDDNWKLLDKITSENGLSNNRITCIGFSSDKTIWVGTESGLDIIKFIGGDISITNILSGKRIAQMFFDSNNDMWICQSEEIFIGNALDVAKHKEQAIQRLLIDTESVTFHQQQDRVLIGTRGLGIIEFNIHKEKLPTFLKKTVINEDVTNDLKNTILTLFEDSYSNLWVGTLYGLYMYRTNKENQFYTIKHEQDNSNTPSSNIISSICYDSNNNLWLATANGISKLEWQNKENYTFKQYNDNRDLSNRISNNKIQSIIEYKDNIFFVSTKSIVKFFDSKRNIFYENQQLNDSLRANEMRYVRASFRDDNNNIWLAFSEGGIGILNVETDKFQKFNFNKSTNSKHRAICHDHTGNIWVSSDDDGLYCLSVNKETNEVEKTKQYGREQFNRHWITSLYVDKQNHMWVGTSNGLYKYNVSQDCFNLVEFPYSKKKNYISGIIEDFYNNIWIIGIQGIYKLPANGEIQYYDIHQGEDIAKTWYILGVNINKDGTIFVGGVNGLSYFNPQEIRPDPFFHKLYISGFEIFNKQVYPDGKRLDKDINLSEKIVLSHKDYQFSISFSSLFYPNPMKVEYAYMLENFDEDWITADASRHYVSYSNLNAGKYIFKVRSSNASGIWLDNTKEIQIIIKQAPWKTWWAYILYFLILSGIIALVFKMLYLGSKLKYEEALNKWKLEYYINISYGFKVPLTLIYAPLQKLLKNYHLMPENEVKDLLAVMMQNVDKLSYQISQLMEFRKIDLGKSSMSLTATNAIQLIKNVYNIFRETAASKEIEYIFDSNVDAVTVTVDTAKVEVALYNLLSNTFKYALERGEIKVTCNLDSSDYKLWIAISVDKVMNEEYKKTFDNFETVNNQENKLHPGVDLSIASDYIKMHQSHIITENRGKEYELRFFILLGESHYSNDQLKKMSTNDSEYKLPKMFSTAPFVKSESTTPEDATLPLIFLYQGDPELDAFIKQSLSAKYNVKIKNGVFDIKDFKETLPSSVIIDLSYNDETKFDICRQIRKNPSLLHISIIFLSSLTGENDKQKAYEMGADAYITKPFDLLYLTTRIIQSIDLRKTIKEKVRKELIVNPKEITITSDNEIFLANVMNIIEENISDPEFNIDNLAEKLNISRSMLYRKLNQQTNLPPVEFIKKVRLKRAANLLGVTSYNVNEVSIMVGFSDQRYFSSCFKKEYGLTPKKYSLLKRRKDTSD